MNNFFKAIIISILITHTFTQTCETTTPTIIMNCSTLSTTTNSCCFYKTLSGEKKCGFIGSKTKGVKVIDDITYHCDNFKGATCSDNKPADAAECFNYGASTNSCCLGEAGNVKGCYWWGEYKRGTATYNGMSITCDTVFMRISYAVLLAILFYI
jgi:hypothetical protein